MMTTDNGAERMTKLSVDAAGRLIVYIEAQSFVLTIEVTRRTSLELAKQVLAHAMLQAMPVSELGELLESAR